MKRMNPCRLVITLALFSIIATCNPLQAQVYKVVDENGNVTYTDRPPAEGAKPVDLPPLSIVEAPDYSQAAGQEAGQGATAGEEKKLSVRDLRRIFRDFAIVSPKADESIWNPEQAVNVSWGASSALQPGMGVIVTIDGVQQEKTTQNVIPVESLERGAHTIEAVLVDEVNRRIATAQPVTFFVRRPSIYNNPNRPRPTPRG